MKIYIGSDHAGFEMKGKLKAFLVDLSYEVEDKGAFRLDTEDDYPDFVQPVAEAVAKDNLEAQLLSNSSFGIILGGSGQGEAMCANRVKGVRSAVYYGGLLEIPKLAREHNNANILSLGARFISQEEAEQVVKIFLETPFSNEERHVRRINEF